MKNYGKKIQALALALAVSLLFSACGTREDPPETQESSVSVSGPENLSSESPDPQASSEPDAFSLRLQQELSPENPLVVAARYVVGPDESGVTRVYRGFHVVDAQGNIVSAIPAAAVSLRTIDGLRKEEAFSDQYEALLAELSVVSETEENLDGVIVSAFFYSRQEDLCGDLANPLDAGKLGVSFPFVCAGSGLPRVYHNGTQLTVTDSGNGTFLVSVFGSGPVIVASSDGYL